MAKRVAEKQINNQGHLESEDEVINEIQVADPLVLAKRKILAPKRLGRKLTPSLAPMPENGGSEREAKMIALNEQFLEAIQSIVKPNTVADLTPIAQKYISYYSSLSTGVSSLTVPSSKVPALSSFNFASQGGLPSNTKPLPSFKPVTSLESKPASVSTPVAPAAANPAPASTGFGGFAGFGKLSHKPLNSTESAKPSHASTNGPTSFNADVNTKSSKLFAETTVPNAVPVAPKPAAATKETPVAIDVDSDSSSDGEIEIKGPQFTLSAPPVTKNSPFSFGPKPVAKKDDSDSESEVEIKGPVFTFDKPIKDSVFKLDKPTAKLSAPAFSFSADTKPESGALSETPAESKPLFSFLATKDKSVTSADSNKPKPFSFGSTTDHLISNSATSQPKPFTFGSNKPESEIASSQPKPFTFGSSKPELESSQPKPFSFETTKSQSSNVAAEENPFSFGSNEASKTSSSAAPSKLFSFAPASNKEAPKDDTNASGTNVFSGAKPFSFGKPADANVAERNSTLFGAQSSSDKVTTAAEPNSINFKSNSTPFGSTQPQLGSKSEDPKNDAQSANTAFPSFSFGKSALNNVSSAEKPLFQFPGSDALKKEADPDIKAAAPLFSFKPALEQGSSVGAGFNFRPTPASGDKPESTEATKPAFSFGAKANTPSPAPNFGSPVFGALSPAAAFTFGGASKPNDQNGNDDDEKVEEEESTAQFEPVAKLSAEKLETPITGEEGEEVLYNQRAKLMLFDPQSSGLPYTNKGLGDLKVLKNSETGKSRIVIRADGGLRVLLNAPVSKDMTYSTVGTKMVRVPTINPDTKKIEFYVFQVKTPENASQFLETLNSAKG